MPVRERIHWDLFISEQDIHIVVGRFAIEAYKCNNKDVKSVHMSMQEHHFIVFNYKESGVHVRGAITRENIPFTKGYQTLCQQHLMFKHTF